MISDGEDAGCREDVSSLKAEGVPCHNVVIEKDTRSYYGGTFSASATEAYSKATGGMNLRDDGSSSSGVAIESTFSSVLL